MIRSYRMKPVAVEAIQFTADNDRAVVVFLGSGYAGYRHDSIRGLQIHVATLEGMMTAQPGDFIVRRRHRGLQVCGPEFFHATYEAVA